MAEKQDRSKRKIRSLAVLCFGLFLGAGATVTHWARIPLPAEEFVLDCQQRYSMTPFPESSPILLISIRDLSSRPWPWPRLDYTLLLQALRPVYPQVVAFEIPFHGADTFEETYDRQLATWIGRMRSVVFPAVLLRTDDPQPIPQNLTFIPYRGSIEELPVYHGGFWPLELFASHVHTGASNLSVSRFEPIRRVPLVFRFKDAQNREHLMPAWILETYAQYLEADLSRSEVLLGERIRLRDKDGKILKEIPIDSQGSITLRFYREIDNVPRYEYGDILMASENIRSLTQRSADLNTFRKKLVVVGREAEGTYEPLETPWKPMPPVHLYLHALHNILNDSMIRTPSFFMVAALLILTAVITVSVPYLLGWVRGSLITLMFLIALALLCFFSFELNNLWFPSVTLHTTALIGWIAGLLFNYLFSASPPVETR